jgi:hypothetical protein
MIKILILATLIVSVYTNCPEGTFLSASGSDLGNHGTCTTCYPVCLTCGTSGNTGCDTFISRVKGIDGSNALICGNADVRGAGGSILTTGQGFGYGVGYNSKSDKC